MSWNYRVMRRAFKSSTGEVKYQYAMYEVYYDEEKKPTAWSKEPTIACAEDLEGLKLAIELQQEAVIKPVLDYDNEGKIIE